MSSPKTCIRQAEFLNQLSSLLNKYQAEIYIEDRGDVINRPCLMIDACGTWIPFHDIGRTLNVDNCITATEATISHGMALATPSKAQATP